MARLTDLRTEHRQTPTGIDVTPRFSWVVTADRRGPRHLCLRDLEAHRAGRGGGAGARAAET